MLRQVALQLRFKNTFQEVAKKHSVKLRVLDCKSFNKTGMSLLIELVGEPRDIKAAAAAIASSDGVRQAIKADPSDHGMTMLVVSDMPAICRASNDSAIVCVDCPLNSEGQPASWRFLTRRASDLRAILARLAGDGIEARIIDIAPLERKAELTGRQKEIVTAAVTHGFFQFPRGISLTELSILVGVKPSTLSEILRSAERRIMASAMNVSLQED
jgi:predicted DNA binding protein